MVKGVMNTDQESAPPELGRRVETILQTHLDSALDHYASGRYSLGGYNYGRDAVDAIRFVQARLPASLTLADALVSLEKLKQEYSSTHADTEGIGAGTIEDLIRAIKALD